MNHSRRLPPQSLAQILAMPLVLASLSLAGLVLGLTGDGWRDVLAVSLLFVPLATLGWHWRRRGRRSF